MGKCLHKNFKASVDITRLTDLDDSDNVTGYTSDIEVHCIDCMMPFHWVGLSAGYSVNEPKVNVDGLTLRAPIAPFKE